MTVSSGCGTGPNLVITNARLIDGTGAAPVTDVSILVSGDRIDAAVVPVLPGVDSHDGLLLG